MAKMDDVIAMGSNRVWIADELNMVYNRKILKPKNVCCDSVATFESR